MHLRISSHLVEYGPNTLAELIISIDIDALFDDDGADDGVAPYEGKGKAKAEPTTPSKLKISDSQAGNGGSVKDEPDRTPVKHKPKRGRIISNEAPLDDFNRLISGEGDVFRKAIQDLGAVVKENVESSFSRQAFPLAIECLQAMRKTALVYEEVDTYNTYVDHSRLELASVKNGQGGGIDGIGTD